MIPVGLLWRHVWHEEWEALCIRLCVILGVRNIIEQPVGSRFFRHPDVQAQHLFIATLCLSSVPWIFLQALVQALHLRRVVVHMGAFAAVSQRLL